MRKQGIVRLTIFFGHSGRDALCFAVWRFVWGKEILPMAAIETNQAGAGSTGGFSAVYEASDEGIEDFDSKMGGTITIFAKTVER